jgi:hypothetical protein
MLRKLGVACLPVLLAGCVVHDAYDVATAPIWVGRTAYHVARVPVRASSKVVDWTTTSQAEADRNAGRRMRKDRKRERKAERKEARQEARDGGGQPY